MVLGHTYGQTWPPRKISYLLHFTKNAWLWIPLRENNGNISILSPTFGYDIFGKTDAWKTKNETGSTRVRDIPSKWQLWRRYSDTAGSGSPPVLTDSGADHLLLPPERSQLFSCILLSPHLTFLDIQPTFCIIFFSFNTTLTFFCMISHLNKKINKAAWKITAIQTLATKVLKSVLYE
jgi:hypothetical protein